MSDGDKNRIKGIGDTIEGDVKEGVGEVSGDRKLEAEGEGDKLKGEGENIIADIKDKVGDFFNKDKKD